MQLWRGGFSMSTHAQISLVLLVIGALFLPQANCFAQDVLPPALEEVAASTRQWTGVAVSKCGRTFVSYPRWTKGLPYSVAELDASGMPTPFPTKEWNTWTGIENPRERFVAVQSIFVDDKNHVWVLDTGNPEFNGVIPNAAKLVEVDLAGPKVLNTFIFPASIAKPDSYLNDVRVDSKTRTAFITDSGNGAIIVVYLGTKQYRRLLDSHPSTHAEKDVFITVAGSKWLRDGKVPQVHADGIALDSKGGQLYFQALTGKTLYRVATDVLRDPTLDDEAIAAKLTVVAEVGPSDGLLFGPEEKLYIASLEHNAVRTLTREGRLEVIMDGEEIAWPDSFSVDPEGRVYFTVSRIHEGRTPSSVYKIFRLAK
jgi:sugar lactone lactonase YvrE